MSSPHRLSLSVTSCFQKWFPVQTPTDHDLVESLTAFQRRSSLIVPLLIRVWGYSSSSSRWRHHLNRQTGQANIFDPVSQRRVQINLTRGCPSIRFWSLGSFRTDLELTVDNRRRQRQHCRSSGQTDLFVTLGSHHEWRGLFVVLTVLLLIKGLRSFVRRYVRSRTSTLIFSTKDLDVVIGGHLWYWLVGPGRRQALTALKLSPSPCGRRCRWPDLGWDGVWESPDSYRRRWERHQQRLSTDPSTLVTVNLICEGNQQLQDCSIAQFSTILDVLLVLRDMLSARGQGHLLSHLDDLSQQQWSIQCQARIGSVWLSRPMTLSQPFEHLDEYQASCLRSVVSVALDTTLPTDLCELIVQHCCPVSPDWSEPLRDRTSASLSSPLIVLFPYSPTYKKSNRRLTVTLRPSLVGFCPIYYKDHTLTHRLVVTSRWGEVLSFVASKFVCPNGEGRFGLERVIRLCSWVRRHSPLVITVHRANGQEECWPETGLTLGDLIDQGHELGFIYKVLSRVTPTTHPGNPFISSDKSLGPCLPVDKILITSCPRSVKMFVNPCSPPVPTLGFVLRRYGLRQALSMMLGSRETWFRYHHDPSSLHLSVGFSLNERECPSILSADRSALLRLVDEADVVCRSNRSMLDMTPSIPDWLFPLELAEANPDVETLLARSMSSLLDEGETVCLTCRWFDDMDYLECVSG